jgi:hypothetical protein
MKKVIIAAILTIALVAATNGKAQANNSCSYGIAPGYFSINLGLNIAWSGIQFGHVPPGGYAQPPCNGGPCYGQPAVGYGYGPNYGYAYGPGYGYGYGAAPNYAGNHGYAGYNCYPGYNYPGVEHQEKDKEGKDGKDEGKKDSKE